MLRIPLQPNTPYQHVTTRLGESLVDITLNFNSLSRLFSMHLTIDQNFTLSGISLILGQDFFAPYPLEMGHLFMVSQHMPHVEPTLENLGLSNHLAWMAPQI